MTDILTTLAIVAAAIYAVGIMGAFISGLIDVSVYKDSLSKDPSASTFIAEHQRKAIAGRDLARRPYLWPLIFVRHVTTSTRELDDLIAERDRAAAHRAYQDAVRWLEQSQRAPARPTMTDPTTPTKKGGRA